MIEPRMPRSLKIESKPSNFCPGCGYGLILKTLGEVIDEMNIVTKTVIGLDIGCNLLAWDYFNIDTFQTHHGRVTPFLSGYKRSEKNSVSIGIAGDGGLYSIGLQGLLHTAHRNEPITVIGVNNTLYGMTGGQAAPTTMPGQVTDTTPGGEFTNEKPLFGPELLKNVAHDHAYIARATVLNIPGMKNMMKNAIETQLRGNFSFIEVISLCSTNWKTNAAETLSFASKMGETFKTGVINE
jgi:2-oxoglutarate ferredoxin oxidoreductase subunit beta